MESPKTTQKKQLFNHPQNLENRRASRKQPTEPERRLWRVIRGGQLGVKFRRQHGIGPYIADFYCAELKLVVEIDGDSHFQPKARADDQIRDGFMRANEIEVIRFSNHDIMQKLEAAAERLFQVVQSRKRESFMARGITPVG